MKLLLAHENPDLDALGSLALARRLHPEGVAAVSGTLAGSPRAAFNLARDALKLVPWEELEIPEDEEFTLVIVDTHERARLGPAAPLVDGAQLEVWDHHPDGDLSGPPGVIRQSGSCATLLSNRLRELGLAPTPLQATLALAGIMADTLGLLASATTPDDFQAAAWLAAQGADLERVRSLCQEPLPSEARGLLAQLLADGARQQVNGRSVLTLATTPAAYLPGASVASEALHLTDCDAVVLALGLTEGDASDVIARSREGAFDVGAALAELGGGGHRAAASARYPAPPQEALTRALQALASHAERQTVASDVMTRHLITLPADAAVGEAYATLARWDHSGAPVLDDAGRVQGTASRRDLERAVRHGMGNARVGTLLTDAVIVRPNEAIARVAQLMSDVGSGRALVMDEERLLGIITRHDLLKVRRQAPPPEAAARVIASLDDEQRRVLTLILEKHLPAGASLFLVGGTVRDALLGRPPLDLDLVFEGENAAAQVGESLAAEWGSDVVLHEAYGNATLRYGSRTLDLINARDEHYAFPGAAPTPAPGDLSRDLARRDFTVNAIALRLRLTAGSLNGSLIDPHGGLRDLEAGILRCLHPLSFLEDPSRIVRGARLAVRLGMALQEDDLASIPGALEGASPSLPGNARLAEELRLTLAELRPAAVATRLTEWHALEGLYGPLTTLPALLRLDAWREAGEDVPSETYGIVWLAGSDPGFADRWSWPRRRLQSLERVRAANDDLAVASLSREEALALIALEPERESAIREARARPPRVLRGADVLALGVPAGKRVGEILATVTRARQEGEVRGFDEELALARELVRTDN